MLNSESEQKSEKNWTMKRVDLGTVCTDTQELTQYVPYSQSYWLFGHVNIHTSLLWG